MMTIAQRLEEIKAMDWQEFINLDSVELRPSNETGHGILNYSDTFVNVKITFNVNDYDEDTVRESKELSEALREKVIEALQKEIK